MFKREKRRYRVAETFNPEIDGKVDVIQKPAVHRHVVMIERSQNESFASPYIQSRRSRVEIVPASSMSGTDAQMDEVVAALEHFAPDHLLVRD